MREGPTARSSDCFWDFLPTVAEIVDAQHPDDIDGISFLPALSDEGEQKKHDYLYWEFHENNGRQAIRKGNWKAVRYDVHNNGKIELYDLDADISETTDLADVYPDMIAEFDSLMSASRTESDLFEFK